MAFFGGFDQLSYNLTKNGQAWGLLNLSSITCFGIYFVIVGVASMIGIFGYFKRNLKTTSILMFLGFFIATIGMSLFQA